MITWRGLDVLLILEMGAMRRPEGQGWANVETPMPFLFSIFNLLLTAEFREYRMPKRLLKVLYE